MPYIFKHRRPPEPWAEFRKPLQRRLWLKPLLYSDWLAEWGAYGLSRWSFLELLEYAGSFSILIAVIFYFLDAPARTQQKHYQAWQVINTAQGKGGAGGRIDALQDLNADHVPLVGVDLVDAFLQGLDLPHADLRRSDLRGADLKSSRLEQADLETANLRSANSRNADMKKSNLRDVNFLDADLAEASLEGANVGGANFERARFATGRSEGDSKLETNQVDASGEHSCGAQCAGRIC